VVAQNVGDEDLENQNLAASGTRRMRGKEKKKIKRLRRKMPLEKMLNKRGGVSAGKQKNSEV